MKNLVTFKPAFLLTLFLSSPLSAAKPPAWTRGPDPKYPEATYITGVGIGDDLDSARSSARAEISKVFHSRVEQLATDVQTESSVSLGKKRGPAQGTQKSETRTRVLTESLLEGVQVVETWFDAKKKKHYALAVLNKPVARRALSTQIVEKEEIIRSHAARAKAAPSSIEQARWLAQALRECQERDALSARRRAVDPVAVPDLPDGASTADIKKSLDEALSKIRFVVETESVEGSRLKETLTEKITSLGFKVGEGEASTPTNPALKIFCRLSVEPFDRGNPSWKFFQWKGVFEMREDLPQSKVLASAAPSGSEGHLTEATARAKTLDAGEEGLAQEAGRRIEQYIFRE
jgi:hypothetical protein